MDGNLSLRRTSTRNRVKIDLNSPAAEADVAAAMVDLAAGGFAGAPIDLEASDDEIELSSPRRFHQARNQHRRAKHPVVVVVDEEQDVHPCPPAVHVHDLAPFTHCTHVNKRRRTPLNRIIINCESFSVSEDDADEQKNEGTPVPNHVVPKEPTFSCPICFGALVLPCSTACGHIFCEGCIKAAIQEKKVCPVCRARLTMKKSFHRVFLPTST